MDILNIQPTQTLRMDASEHFRSLASLVNTLSLNLTPTTHPDTVYPHEKQDQKKSK